MLVPAKEAVRTSELETLDENTVWRLITLLQRLAVPAVKLSVGALSHVDEALQNTGYSCEDRTYTLEHPQIYDPILARTAYSTKVAMDFGLTPFHRDKSPVHLLGSTFFVVSGMSGVFNFYCGLDPDMNLRVRNIDEIIFSPEETVDYLASNLVVPNLPDRLFCAEIHEGEAIAFDPRLLHAATTTELGERNRLATGNVYTLNTKD